MIQHLANCHGEWNLIFAFIGSLPFVGMWLRMKIQKSCKNKQETNGDISESR